jgi:hypothetical protein
VHSHADIWLHDSSGCASIIAQLVLLGGARVVNIVWRACLVVEHQLGYNNDGGSTMGRETLRIIMWRKDDVLKFQIVFWVGINLTSIKVYGYLRRCPVHQP